ncbi:hypothetical protein NQ315_013171 [Exocentrus adspersus]|uniref:Transposase n=1 Tax=Exocentrus adspersus TaxID=1586481 RepID=A0AAV8VBZ0_9CUCU|nr:hypothetical protein NQ315_013171 [Exocentrus adspersus]
MERYSADEIIDMYNIYHRIMKNCSRTEDNHIGQSSKVWRDVYSSFIHWVMYQKRRLVHDTTNEINVIAQIHINPETSQRNIALESNLSKSGVQKIIKKHKYHDYKVKPVQTIHPGDNERRLQFCNWFRDEIREDHDVPCKILWSDESLFTNSGIFNRRNKHFYATQNPYLIQEVRSQIRFSLNVWCGLLNNNLLGPYFIQGNLTGQTYLNFMQNDLEDILDNLPLQTVRNLRWFQHDGAGTSHRKDCATIFGQ